MTASYSVVASSKEVKFEKWFWQKNKLGTFFSAYHSCTFFKEMRMFRKIQKQQFFSYPTTVYELQTSIPNKASHQLLHVFALFIPPSGEKGNFNIDKTVRWEFNQIADNCIQNVLHPCVLDGVVGTIIVFVNLLWIEKTKQTWKKLYFPKKEKFCWARYCF